MSSLDFNAEAFLQAIRDTDLAQWGDALCSAVLNQGHGLKHGHLPRWEKAVDLLPVCTESALSVDSGVVTLSGCFADDDHGTLQQCLADLMPWRKGPFKIGPVVLDTEWRSDWKWDRIEPHIRDLRGRIVLDVGCGNGYHLWRMRKAGASQVLGIDPSLLYLMQFTALQHFARDPTVQMLPIPMESLPLSMALFDTVFSMGVLYHRRSAVDHLQELRHALRPNGQLVLETLVIPDSGVSSLQIKDRYANMRNVYELPSVALLERWVHEQGFQEVKTVSLQQTSRREQRSTDWMTSHSLAQALDPDNPSLTIEGYPRPLRAVVVAVKGQ